MKWKARLLFGPLAGVLLGLGILGLARAVPGYSHVRQTVSEIGEVGSPARIPFAILLCCVAGCVLIFASGIHDLADFTHHSQVTAYLVGGMALSAAGVGVFAHPHPLHNVFGISELLGYQAPLAFAITWRRDTRARAPVALSWILFVLIWIAIALNLSSMDRQGLIWAHVKPVYGLAQRALFAAWFFWCGLLGILLFRRDWRETGH